MKNKFIKISMSVVASAIMLLSFNGEDIKANENKSFVESSLKGLKNAQFSEVKLTDDKNAKAKELSTIIQNSLSSRVEDLEKKIEIVDELKTGDVIEIASKLEKANITTFVEENDKQNLAISQKEKLLNTESLPNSSLKNSEKIIPLSTKDSLFKNLSSKKEVIEKQELKEKNRLAAEKRKLAAEAEKKRIEEEKAKKEASKKNYYTTNPLNVRSNPSLDAEVLTTFKKEYNFEAYPYNDEWLEIRYKEQIAYVSKKYVKEGAKISTSTKTNGSSVSHVSTNGNKIYNLTAYEKDLLERLVQAEAGNQPYEGRVAVATVVANRIEFNGSFANNVTDVIYAKNQFSPTMNGMIDSVTPSAETKKAVEAVFSQGQRNLPSNVVYFCTNEIRYHSWINTRAFHSVIGGHSFFYNYDK